MENYELGDNDCLGNLYMRREKWIPTYIRRKFCARISTIQRSESMNKFFKDYVCSSSTIRNFVYQYEQVLNAHYLKEKEQCVKTKRFNANFENKLQDGSRGGKILYKKDVYEISRRVIL